MTLAPVELVTWLFGEAWEYRRRRHRVVAAGLLVIVAAAVGGLLVGRGGNSSGPSASAGPARVEPPSRVLASHNVLLVGGESFEAVDVMAVLRRPGTGVVASIDGRSVILHRFTSQFVRRPMTGFTGKVKSARSSAIDAGIPGSHGGTVVVRLLITYADGSRVATRFSVHFKHGLRAA